jgi:hypothetical protein
MNVIFEIMVLSLNDIALVTEVFHDVISGGQRRHWVASSGRPHTLSVRQRARFKAPYRKKNLS